MKRWIVAVQNMDTYEIGFPLVEAPSAVDAAVAADIHAFQEWGWRRSASHPDAAIDLSVPAAPAMEEAS